MRARCGWRRTPSARWLAGAVAAAAWACGPAAAGSPEAPAPDREPAAAVAQEAREGSGGVNAERHRDAPYVIMISFDGFRHDYYDRWEAPNFRRVIRRGARAVSLIPVFPTKTFPNHYSLATGMYPARHGLVDNYFWDPERQARYGMADREAVEDGSWYGGEPIWVTAETQGMVAASYFWVGTEAAIDGVQPTHWFRYDASVPNEERVDRALEWLALPEAERPHLVMLYFSDVDWQGHEHGPDAPETAAAVRQVDAMLGRLLDGVEGLPIADRVHLVLVSDHGMAAGDPDRFTLLTDVVDLEGVEAGGAGPYVTLYVGEDPERAERLRGQLAEALPRASVLQIEETPARWHYRDNPRLGDLLVLAELPWLVGVDPRGAEWAEGGHHGWDPAHEAMHGIFVAAGPAIRRGVLIPSVESVHVYPLVAHILGLEPNPEADGRLEELRPILR